jgi:hypothetical protein
VPVVPRVPCAGVRDDGGDVVNLSPAERSEARASIAKKFSGKFRHQPFGNRFGLPSLTDWLMANNRLCNGCGKEMFGFHRNYKWNRWLECMACGDNARLRRKIDQLEDKYFHLDYVLDSIRHMDSHSWLRQVLAAERSGRKQKKRGLDALPRKARLCVPVVYFLDDGTAIKIGRAEATAKRIPSIQTGNPRRLSLVAEVPGGNNLEQSLHGLFRAERLRSDGEWFARSPRLLWFIQSINAHVMQFNTIYRLASRKGRP